MFLTPSLVALTAAALAADLVAHIERPTGGEAHVSLTLVPGTPGPLSFEVFPSITALEVEGTSLPLTIIPLPTLDGTPAPGTGCFESLFGVQRTSRATAGNTLAIEVIGTDDAGALLWEGVEVAAEITAWGTPERPATFEVIGVDGNRYLGSVSVIAKAGRVVLETVIIDAHGHANVRLRSVATGQEIPLPLVDQALQMAPGREEAAALADAAPATHGEVQAAVLGEDVDGDGSPDVVAAGTATLDIRDVVAELWLDLGEAEQSLRLVMDATIGGDLAGGAVFAVGDPGGVTYEWPVWFDVFTTHVTPTVTFPVRPPREMEVVMSADPPGGGAPELDGCMLEMKLGAQCVTPRGGLVEVAGVAGRTMTLAVDGAPIVNDGKFPGAIRKLDLVSTELTVSASVGLQAVRGVAVVEAMDIPGAGTGDTVRYRLEAFRSDGTSAGVTGGAIDLRYGLLPLLPDPLGPIRFDPGCEWWDWACRWFD